MHSVHPPILEHGLADGCPRCEVLGAYPRGLDSDNANALIERFECGLPWRSLAERAAFMQLRIDRLESAAGSLERQAADALRDGDEVEAEVLGVGAKWAREALPQARRDRLDAIWDMAEGSTTDFGGSLRLEVVEADGVAS